MLLNMRDNEIREEGREEGQKDMGKLMLLLFKQGRTEDADRAVTDPEFRDQLYREFQIA